MANVLRQGASPQGLDCCTTHPAEQKLEPITLVRPSSTQATSVGFDQEIRTASEQDTLDRLAVAQREAADLLGSQLGRLEAAVQRLANDRREVDRNSLLTHRDTNELLRKLTEDRRGQLNSGQVEANSSPPTLLAGVVEGSALSSAPVKATVPAKAVSSLLPHPDLQSPEHLLEGHHWYEPDVQYLPLEKKIGSLLTFATGFTGKPKLIAYQIDKLQGYMAIPAILSVCSIFRLRKSLYPQLLLQPFLILMFYMPIRMWVDGKWPFGLGGDGVPLVDIERMQAEVEPIIALSSNLNTFVPFVLGLYISKQLQRWWSIRAHCLQPFFRYFQSLSLYMGIAIPMPKAEKLRKRIERYCLLSHRLLYISLRKQFDDTTLRKLMNEDLLTEHERQHIERCMASLPPGACAESGGYDLELCKLPFSWILHVLQRVYWFSKLKKVSHFDMPVPLLIRMHAICLECRYCIENIEMMLTSQLPFPYVHLVCLLVHFVLFFSCMRCGLQLGTQAVTPGVMTIVVQMLSVITINALYSGLLCLTVVLMDPFGDDVVDFPAALFQHRLWKSQLYSRGLLEDNDDMDTFIRAMGTSKKCVFTIAGDEDTDSNVDEADLLQEGGVT